MVQNRKLISVVDTETISKNEVCLKSKISRVNLMKMLHYILLCGTLCVISSTIHAQSGTIGNISWSISNGTLGITGTGIIPDYTTGSAPWYSYQSSISSIVIGNGISRVGNCAFYNCKYLTNIFMPISITSIGEEAFFGCDNLISVRIPNSVTTIGKSAFAFCQKMASITISNSITDIGEGAFFFCNSLTSITIPSLVTNISNGTFQDCHNLISVIIPNSVTSIGEDAFNQCWNLTSVSIPNSVINIGKFAFLGCEGLNEIVNYAIIPQTIDVNVFRFVDKSIVTLRVPAESVTSYRTAEVWKGFKNIEAMNQ